MKKKESILKVYFYLDKNKVKILTTEYNFDDFDRNEDVFLVSELEAAQDGKLKEVADYCKRFKENAICKMTWDDSEETAK